MVLPLFTVGGCRCEDFSAPCVRKRICFRGNRSVPDGGNSFPRIERMCCGNGIKLAHEYLSSMRGDAKKRTVFMLDDNLFSLIGAVAKPRNTPAEPAKNSGLFAPVEVCAKLFDALSPCCVSAGQTLGRMPRGVPKGGRGGLSTEQTNHPGETSPGGARTWVTASSIPLVQPDTYSL